MAHFKVTAELRLDVRRIMKEYNETLDASCADTAKLGAVIAYRYFLGQTQHLGTGEMEGSFGARASKYGKKGGWIYGTFGSNAGDWADTLGGRSQFFEYGRSAPGKGRPDKNRGDWVNTGAVGDGQPPRPFMRPSYAVLKGRFPGIVAGGTRVSAKKLNGLYK